MITISHTNFNSSFSLANILSVKTQGDMLKICSKLDLYVSPNVKKGETASRLAGEILLHPINVLSQICKAALQLLDRTEKTELNQYIVVKQRKTLYKLQKFGLVQTYEDNEKYQLENRAKNRF